MNTHLTTRGRTGIPTLTPRRRTTRRPTRTRAAKASPSGAGSHVNQSLLRLQGRSGLGISQETRHVCLRKEEIRAHRRSRQHKALVGVGKIHRQVRKIKVPTLQHHESGMGCAQGSLMGQTLKQGCDKGVKESHVRRRKILKPNKPQKPRKHPHRMGQSLRMAPQRRLQSRSLAHRQPNVVGRFQLFLIETATKD